MRSLIARAALGGLATILAGALAEAQNPAQQGSADSRPGGRTTTLPMKTERVLRFTTSEGTWMSVDVSPDGRTLVFDLVGDLYTLPIAGGKATRITDGPGVDGQPRFSPDGKTIVFTSDRDGAEKLYFINADGSGIRKFTRDDKQQFMSPVWSPDGKYVIVCRRAVQAYDHDLYMYHKDGGSGIKILDKVAGPAFGSNPRYLWATTAGGASGFGGYQLFMYDRETGERFTRSNNFGGAMRPALSPDGKWLIYVARHDSVTGLRMRDLATGDERWLVPAVQHDEGEANDTRDAWVGAAFTPDSRSFVFSSFGKIWRADVASGKLTEIPFTADVEQHFAALVRFENPVNDSTLTVKQIRDAHPSPDGRRLAFTALQRVWVMDVPSGSPKRLTSATEGESHPVWSPDGRSIAYVAWNDTEGGAIKRVSANGGESQRLTSEPGFYNNVNFTPNGTRILATKSPRSARIAGEGPAASDLVWIPSSCPSNGCASTLIAPASGFPYFVRGDTSRIYVGATSMRWDGTDKKTHIAFARDPNTSPGAPLISPDGERAIVEATDQVYLVTVPPPGKEPPPVNLRSPNVPARRVTVLGGDFIGWSADGKSFHYSLGNSFFTYDVARGDSLVRDSTDRARDAAAARGDSAGRGAGPAQQGAGASAVMSASGVPAYEPSRVQVRITVPRDKPSGVVALRGARIITMKGGADDVIENGDIVVQGNRIVAVGARGKVNVPSGAKVIDVKGKTILPGWVDIHAHLRPAGDVHRGQPWEYLANLAWGVTSTRDPQTGSTDVLSYEDMVATGEMIGPRIFSTGPGVFQGHEISSLNKARDVMHRYADYFDTRYVKQYKIGDRKDRQWLNMAGHELKLSSTTEGTRDFKMSLSEMIDGYSGHEHNYSVAPMYDDIVKMIAFSGITYTPTLLVNYGSADAEHYFYTHANPHSDPKVQRFWPHGELDRKAARRSTWVVDEQYGFPRYAATLAKIVKGGGHVGLGGHGQFQGLGVHWELWAIGSGGMPPLDVIRVGTIFGAEAIGVSKDLGSLDAGKLADLQVLDKDPLTDIHNTNSVHYVMINGRLFDASTMDEVWPRQKKFTSAWWRAE